MSEEITTPVDAPEAEVKEVIEEVVEESPETETAEPVQKEKTPEEKKLAEISYRNRQLNRQNRQLAEEVKGTSKKIDDLMAMMQKTDAPKLEEFESADEWLKANLDHQKQPDSKPDNSAYMGYVEESTEMLMETGAEKYEDFEAVVTGDVDITPVMRDTLFLMDNAADVAYYLGKNPSEARKIATLPPIRQAAEVGKIEAKLSQPKKVAKKPTAPDPVSPVGGSSTPSDEIQPVEDFGSFLKKRNKQLGR